MKLFAFLFLLPFFISAGQSLYDDMTVLDFRLEFPQPDWRQQLATNEKLEVDIPARLFVNTSVYDSVGVRYKGHSSSNIPGEKKPFNITMNAFKSGQDLMGYTTLNLNNCFKDPTFVREMIGYRLAAEYMPAAKAAYVTLRINGEYWGVYLNVQQLNKVFLREWFVTDAGNHFKGDPRGDLTWLGTDTARYKANYELKTNEKKDDWSDLVALIDKLNNLPSDRLQAELPKYLNIDRALWYLALCNILVNLDSYIGSGHNHYLYHHPVDDRFHIIPWDLNEVLGTFASQPMTVEQRERLPIFYNQTNPQRPLIAKLLTVPDWRARYIAHFRTMLEEVFTMEYWQPRVERYQNLIRSSVQADTKKLYSMDWFSTNVTTNVQNGPVGSVIPGLYSFITNRRSYLATVPELNQTQAVISTVEHTPTTPNASDVVTVRASVSGAERVLLWWSVDGKAFASIPMTPAAGTYQTELPSHPMNSVIRYSIEAFAPGNVASYSPERAENEYYSYTVEHRTFFPVVINEVMPGNTRTHTDPQGQFDDWIELYNTSANAVQLDDLFLSDDDRAPRKWRFPAGVSIGPGAYLIVWADKDTTDSPGLHSNFQLDKSGERVFLFDSDANGNGLLDSTSFGEMGDDIAWGRIPNGAGLFRFLVTPTPGDKNTILNAIETPGKPSTLSLQVFPNPIVAREASVIIHSNQPVTITMIDGVGREVFRERVSQPEGTAARSLSFEGLPAGAYFIRATTSMAQTTQAVFVLR